MKKMKDSRFFARNIFPAYGEIRSLAVLPEFQNRGIGGTLVGMSLGGEGKNIYEVLTLQVVWLFEKHGFASFRTNGTRPENP